MKRWAWLVAGLWTGCASGDDPANTAGTSFSPSGSATATATATATGASTTSSSTDGSDAATSAQTGDTEVASSGASSTDTDTIGSSGSGSTSGELPNEQPEDGMYSACDTVVDCIGLTTCLTATDTVGTPIDPFCTVGRCKSPLAQCDPTPGGTAVPSCLPTDVGGAMDNVCVLDCSAGQECPQGMDCRTLAAGSICS